MRTDNPKTLYWEGSSKKDFKAFPLAVQKSMGMSLYIVQSGKWPEAVKPWKGLGPGIYELVENDLGNAYRAVYALRIGDAIHVLHAFQKKSKSGISTPQSDMDLIARRLKRVIARHDRERNPI